MMRTVRGIAAIVAVVASVPVITSAQDLAWTRQIGTTSRDLVYDVATDGAGNVYVTGQTDGTLPGQTPSGETDAFVRRYDASGTEIWTRQFGSELWDFALDIATDGAGNVYVAGYTRWRLPGQTHLGSDDAFVRRYDASGTEVWTRQFGTEAGDYARGVATDGAGNVYVTGATSGRLPGQTSAGGSDAFVRRYDPSGAEVWTRQFGSGSVEEAYGAATDDEGNVYVAGITGGTLPDQTSSGGGDTFVRRYDAGGAHGWTRQFGSSSNDFPNGVATDGAGNVYVTGQTLGALPGQTSSGSYDAFVRRYSASGVEGWTRQFGSGSYDGAYGVATDGNGSIYIAGITGGTLSGEASAGSYDAYVRRYDSLGAEVWTRQFGSPSDETGRGVSTDGTGSVYVAGYTDGTMPGETSSGDLDAFVTRFRQRTCSDTSNLEANETGPVSGPIHGMAEPAAGDLDAPLHQLNCTVLVPYGL